jgi:hypothetical protein
MTKPHPLHRRILAAAAAGTLVSIMPAGAAAAVPLRTPANDDLNMEIRPGQVRAGDSIQVKATCYYTANSTATSDAFGTVTLHAVEGADVATVNLRRDLRAPARTA